MLGIIKRSARGVADTSCLPTRNPRGFRASSQRVPSICSGLDPSIQRILMGHQMPPDDDPIIRSIREAGVRPLRPARVGRSSIGGRHPRLVIAGVILLFVFFLLIPTIAMRLSDWLWYREIGFERVFLT